MNTTTQGNIGNSFWDNLSIIAQSILAHVNVSFDGSTKTLRIDIRPAENRIIEIPKTQIEEVENKCLDKAESEELSDKTIEDSENHTGEEVANV